MTRGRRGLKQRLICGTALSLVAMASIGSTAEAVPVVSACDGKIVTRGDWTRIDAPLRIVDYTWGNGYAVDPSDPKKMFVTDSRVVMRSTDGGCYWEEVFALGLLESLPDGHSLFIEQIVIPESPGAGGRLYLLISEANGTGASAAVVRPRVVASRDGGETWFSSEERLLPYGHVGQLHVAPSDPEVLYINITPSDPHGFFLPPPAERATLIYRSTNGGGSWELRNADSVEIEGAPTGPVRNHFGIVRRMAVDPLDKDRLWAGTSAGLYYSSDGGAVWQGMITTEDVGPVDIYAVDVSHPRGRQSLVTAVDPSGVVYSSDDAAKVYWSRAYVPGLRTAAAGIVTVAHAADEGEVIASSLKGVYRRVSDTVWASIQPEPSMLLTHWSSDVTPDAAFYAVEWSGEALVRYESVDSFAGRYGPLSAEFSLDQPMSSLPDLSEVAPLSKPGPAKLAPRRQLIFLAPGESKTIEYRLKLPPRPSPIDVYFLLDSTGSMYGAMLGLQDGLPRIVADLREAGIDVWAGLGEFRTYPKETDAVNFAYRRDRAVGPIDQQLADAFDSLEGSGNSGANLTALFQSATGAGQDVLPPGPSRADLPAGMEAGFGVRRHALRAIVHFADRYFNAPDRDTGSDSRWPPGVPWPGPTFDGAIDALNDSEIEHVGIHMSPAQGEVRRDLQKVSSGTGTVAPAEGIDCNGDNLPELGAGQPLVCGLDADRAYKDSKLVADAVISLLKGLRDQAPVTLEEIGNSGVVSKIEPGNYPEVNLKVLNRLHFKVTYTCNLGRIGEKVSVRFAAEVRDMRVATASTAVICGVTLPPPPAGVSGGVNILPVVPPPPPVLAPGPVPGPASAQSVQLAQAPAPAPAAQPLPAAVPQRQEQPQMVLVHAAHQVREQLTMEHAMVKVNRGRRDSVETAKYIVGVGSLSLLIGFAYMSLAVSRVRTQRIMR